MLIYFALGLWTYIAIALSRAFTYYGSTWTERILGFLLFMLVWPVAPLLIFFIDKGAERVKN